MRLMVFMMMRPCLEARAERKHQAVAFAGARKFDPRHRAHRRVERRADAIGSREPMQIQVGEAGRDLAGVYEQRHVHERSGGPAILAAEEHAIAIAEPPWRVA